jgi:hypothetical protein
MPASSMPERENPRRLPARPRRWYAHWRHYLDYSRVHSGRRKCRCVGERRRGGDGLYMAHHKLPRNGTFLGTGLHYAAR